MYSGYPQLLYFYHLLSQWCVILKSVFSVFSVLSTLALSTRVISCHVVHSRDFHLCHFVPRCPLSRCPPMSSRATLFTPAISTCVTEMDFDTQTAGGA